MICTYSKDRAVEEFQEQALFAWTDSKAMFKAAGDVASEAVNTRDYALLDLMNTIQGTVVCMQSCILAAV
jgi:hypothetical protein